MSMDPFCAHGVLFMSQLILRSRGIHRFALAVGEFVW